jgi:DNA-binding transcriptional ArsR family regulator
MKEQKVLKAIAEPRRREVLALLREKGTMSVGEIAERVAVTQQAVSLHLRVLEDAGLVEARREGTRHLYAVKPEGFKPAHEFVQAFWGIHLPKLKREVEKK